MTDEIDFLDEWEQNFWADVKDLDPNKMSRNQFKHYNRIRIKILNVTDN